MSMPPSALRGGGGSPLHFVKTILVDALEILAIGFLLLVAFEAVPGNPWAAALNAWVMSYARNLLTFAQPYVFVGAVVMALMAALMYLFHRAHALAKLTLTGAGIASAIGLVIHIALGLWPQIQQGTVG
jgi:hypothetical protein